MTKLTAFLDLTGAIFGAILALVFCGFTGLIAGGAIFFALHALGAMCHGTA